MRFLVSFFLACAAWLTAAQAIADVEAVLAVDSYFTCVDGYIQFSALNSTTTQGYLTKVEWDFDDDDVYEEGGLYS